ncbi:hypothetical protein CALVIDRAFT_597067 [Calocera viscosa TUFC12733]|uniref:Elongator complex protein 6 n=1 Tax=Calocera viscosa (strain TUFC12733) TaxID=1330018 RepID=A0A167NTU5_CALVF|nr:hypothetical protein CALVIDRAFT_597067 [Calocera viscosa TUFC12733]
MALIANSLPVASLAEPGHFLLVNDRIAAPGEFILHHVLAASLKDSTAECVLVSFLERLDHWKAIQSKLGVTLETYATRKSFVFVDAFSQITMPPSSPRSQDPLVVPPIDPEASVPLRPLFDTIVGALRSVDPELPKLLLFDEVSLLEWLVPSQAEVTRFWRALFALKQKMGFGLVVLQSLDASHNHMIEFLLSSCTMHLEISPLASGRSSAVTGEIAMQRGPLSVSDGPSYKAVRKQALQYRLTESGAVWIERGTGGGML